jgi:multiple sugar transport system ATP-binding protein
MVYVTHDQLEAMTMADRIAVMDHGVLQQVGTPLDVYNAPANTFVARFIGSPGMNLCPGTLIETDRGLAVDLGALGVSPPLRTPLASAARRGARNVTYGFRPEEVHLDTAGLRLPLILAERIGARTILHLGQGEDTLRAVFQGNPDLPEGDIAFAPDPAAVRLFDATTGTTIREV